MFSEVKSRCRVGQRSAPAGGLKRRISAFSRLRERSEATRAAGNLVVIRRRGNAKNMAFFDDLQSRGSSRAVGLRKQGLYSVKGRIEGKNTLSESDFLRLIIHVIRRKTSLHNMMALKVPSTLPCSPYPAVTSPSPHIPTIRTAAAVDAGWPGVHTAPRRAVFARPDRCEHLAESSLRLAITTPLPCSTDMCLPAYADLAESSLRLRQNPGMNTIRKASNASSCGRVSLLLISPPADVVVPSCHTTRSQNDAFVSWDCRELTLLSGNPPSYPALWCDHVPLIFLDSSREDCPFSPCFPTTDTWSQDSAKIRAQARSYPGECRGIGPSVTRVSLSTDTPTLTGVRREHMVFPGKIVVSMRA